MTTFLTIFVSWMLGGLCAFWMLRQVYRKSIVALAAMRMHDKQMRSLAEDKRDQFAEALKIVERGKAASERDLEALRRTVQPMQEERQKLASEVEPVRIRADALSEEVRQLRQELEDKTKADRKLRDQIQQERSGRIKLEQARIDLQALMEEARRKQEEGLQEWEKLALRCSRNGLAEAKSDYELTPDGGFMPSFSCGTFSEESAQMLADIETMEQIKRDRAESKAEAVMQLPGERR